jgi:hypothetical protein
MSAADTIGQDSDDLTLITDALSKLRDGSLTIDKMPQYVSENFKGDNLTDVENTITSMWKDESAIKTETAWTGTVGKTIVGGIERVPFANVSDICNGLAYAIEYITYSLYFYEEAFVIFMRMYHETLYNGDVPSIMVQTENTFDWMLGWYVGMFNSVGIIAVYCSNAFANYIYMLYMYREYANIKMYGQMMNYTTEDYFVDTQFRP